MEAADCGFAHQGGLSGSCLLVIAGLVPAMTISRTAQDIGSEEEVVFERRYPS
jgi:hypothetical protein